MQIFVTTLGRATEQQQRTLRNLSPDLKKITTVVVQDHERDSLLHLHPRQLVLPPEVRNLGATRQWLVDNLRPETIVLLDDDLDFYWRPDPWDWRLKTPDHDRLDAIFWEVEQSLEYYAHVGLSGREGNNHTLGYGVECTRYMRMLCYNLGMWPRDVRLDRVSGMSDFDTNLQLLTRGLRSWVFYRYAQGQPATQMPGGIAGQRTHETHAAEVARMAEMWPEFVQPTKKANRSGGAFGERDEVIISWKKAIEYA